MIAVREKSKRTMPCLLAWCGCVARFETRNTAAISAVQSTEHEYLSKSAVVGKPVNGGPKFSYHIRARMPSMAGYLYGNSFDVRIKLNTDPNLTPNPIRTHDRAPNPNRPMSQKKTLRPVGVVKHGN